MATLLFTDAEIKNDIDGTNVIYYYTIDEASRRSVRVKGAFDQPAFNEDELRDYAQRLFSGVLIGIETIWSNLKQLPDDNVEFVEKHDFPSDAMKAIPWEGYKLELKSL